MATDEENTEPEESTEPEENTEPGEQEAKQYSPEELQDTGTANGARASDLNLDLLLDVPVNVSLRVGSTDITIRELVKLVEGSVVALDRDSAEAMDVLVNGTLIAHGEIVVVDERFGVRLTDVVSPAERIQNIN